MGIFSSETKKTRESERLGWLDFGKAAGIFIVLLVHAGCALGPVTFYGGMFYMPIFFVAAGYTYRCRREISFAAVVKKRAGRLLLPYFAASGFLWLFFWVKDSVLAGNPLDVKLWSLSGILYARNQMYALPHTGENLVLLDVLNAPLWFLPAMFLVYVYYEAAGRSGKKYLWLFLGLACSVAWHYGTALLLPWSMDAVPYFACFFAAGEALKEQDGIRRLKERPVWGVGLLAAFLVLSRINGGVNLSCGDYGRSMLLYLLVGSAGSMLVFAAGAVFERVCGPLFRMFCFVGRETLVILCFHMFLFMFIKTAAKLLGFGSGAAQAAMVAGSAVALAAAGRCVRR